MGGSGVSLVGRLGGVPLFSGLSAEALERLGAMANVVRLSRRQMLFLEGEPHRGMFVVLDGLVVVYRNSNEGRMLILQVCRAGDALADVPLFEERDAGYPAHARATRDSEVVFLPRKELVAFLREDPKLAWSMLCVFAGRLKEMSLRLEGVTLREVSSRLARYLVREMEAGGVMSDERPVLTLPLAKGSIASYLGTVHETLSRSFARLVREKIVSVDGPRVTILDKRRLERLL